jgi:hypothetical protein
LGEIQEERHLIIGIESIKGGIFCDFVSKNIAEDWIRKKGFNQKIDSSVFKVLTLNTELFCL